MYVFLVLGALHRLVCIALEIALDNTNHQLAFSTVRDAQCSDPADAERILKVVRGNEEIIDSAINILKHVGRFNGVIALNLSRGLSPTRLRDGVFPSLLLAYSTIWVMGLTCWLPMHFLLRWIVACGSAFLIMLGMLQFGRDSVYAAADVLIWASTVMYAMYTALEVYWQGHAFQFTNVYGMYCSDSSPWSYLLAWLVCAVFALVACFRFYGNRWYRKRRTSGLKIGDCIQSSYLRQFTWCHDADIEDEEELVVEPDPIGYSTCSSGSFESTSDADSSLGSDYSFYDSRSDNETDLKGLTGLQLPFRTKSVPLPAAAAAAAA
eukprot:CAMPEP_0206587356 /NCGR_PEP_ID=MMETSP0325_2-20121206/37605_1 /ASSEMBLY_ACC=CAM_ASM_000347 /TAXON_ID=2866 /ORGANISM="Crypthecodinium cohnii, Strain Seligo" /LENGTH=321 /DNA_ID=CAMNT_0054095361 /DNA_START=54 /DNA_END=1016 /DNA_ORIENTATION=-